MLKKSNKKSLYHIQSEWDSTCINRQNIIDAGKDFSLLAVTAPCIINEINSHHYTRILDVGCGTGYLTSLLANHAHTCVGIDISETSISIAQKKYGSPGVHFINSSIADYKDNIQFDACVANMVFSCDPDWINSIHAIHKLLSPKGELLVMLPHPCNWPRYWGFENASWFDYNEEIYIEHDFSISLAKSIGTATYIHRPLSQYINSILDANFILEKIIEPYPAKKIPDNYKYDYPRFFFMKFKKE